LHAVARKLREHLEEIAQLETLHIGKPISDARDEASLGARVFEYYAGAVTKFCGQTIPVGRGGFDFTLRQPMGVVAAIAPWNFPFPIACWKAAPAAVCSSNAASASRSWTGSLPRRSCSSLATRRSLKPNLARWSPPPSARPSKNSSPTLASAAASSPAAAGAPARKAIISNRLSCLMCARTTAVGA